MKFEDAIAYLKQGHRIYRKNDIAKGSLCGTMEMVSGSFYLTIYDVLAEDWVFTKDEQKWNKIYNESL